MCIILTAQLCRILSHRSVSNLNRITTWIPLGYRSPRSNLFSSTFTCFVYHSTMHMPLRILYVIVLSNPSALGLKLTEYVLLILDPNALYAPLGPFNTLSNLPHLICERLYQCMNER